MMQINIVQGKDIAPAPQPIGEIRSGQSVSTAALVGSDCPGLRPTFQVDVGDKVVIGQPLFFDSRRPHLAFCAPVSGTVTQIRRGQRRTLDLIAIAREGKRSKKFRLPQLSDGEGVRHLLLETGQWPAFRTRPFERIPDPAAQPAAIFITAIDTEPLSADPSDVLRQYAGAFRTGIMAIRNLTAGPLFVCQPPNAPVELDADRVQFVTFSGPHPAGLPGTHIHHLMPVNCTRHVWHIGYQDVIAIGMLFETARIWTERIVTMAGAGVREPTRVRTWLGADLNDLVADNSVAGDVDIISGSLLSGRLARFLGRYHNQISVLLQDRDWTDRGIIGRLARLLDGDRAGAIIPTAAHENVMAIDIPPIPLLRALSAGDAETAKRLGCLELAESDMALLTHVCPSKLDYAPLLRQSLDEIESWI
ncbi:MAG: NADH:ubiquinone reductase (Na(+)-transporting) subunit A [Hyphomicrobiales bacterium]|nr:NADH:ubiquinone reductase (Na(+)-transporting) subunit A [Hyphomicrobiales bacterium]